MGRSSKKISLTTDRPTDLPTDRHIVKVGCRVACTRLKKIYNITQAARNYNSVANKCNENEEEINMVSTAITRLGENLRSLFSDVAHNKVDEVISGAAKTASQKDEGIYSNA